MAAGSDHDLSSIFCNQFANDSGMQRCDLEINHTHTKKVVKIHMNPKYLIESFEMPWIRELDRNEQRKFAMKIVMNDIALIQVQPFDLSEKINVLPGCLFESNDQSFGGHLLAAGWFGIKNFDFSCSLNIVYPTG